MTLPPALSFFPSTSFPLLPPESSFTTNPFRLTSSTLSSYYPLYLANLPFLSYQVVLPRRLDLSCLVIPIPPYHSYLTTPTLPLLPYHSYLTTPVLRRLPYDAYLTTPALPLLPYHSCLTTPALPLLPYRSCLTASALPLLPYHFYLTTCLALSTLAASTLILLDASPALPPSALGSSTFTALPSLANSHVQLPPSRLTSRLVRSCTFHLDSLGS